MINTPCAVSPIVTLICVWVWSLSRAPVKETCPSVEVTYGSVSDEIGITVVLLVAFVSLIVGYLFGRAPATTADVGDGAGRA